MAGQNPQLQARAGKNLPDLLTVVDGMDATVFKMESNQLLLLEVQRGETLLAALAALLTAAEVAIINNNSGANLGFELVYEDAFGTQRVVDSDTVNDGDQGSLGFSSGGGFLQEGEKLYVRVAGPGSATAGNGVRVVRGVSKSTAVFLADPKTYKLTTTRVELKAPPGVVGMESVIYLFNQSASNLNYTVGVRYPDGFEDVSALTPLAANGEAAVNAPLPLQGDLTIVVQFAALPPNGYVLVKSALALAQNVIPVSP